MRYKNLLVIGTSHVSKESLNLVENAFNAFKPDIVAVELDRRRYLSLFEQEKRPSAVEIIKRVGLKGYVLLAIGSWFEKKIGEETGVLPGSEMKLALKLAKSKKAIVALIDQDIEITLRKFSQRFSWKEKWNLLKDVFFGVFSRKKVAFDVARLPDKNTIDSLIKDVKEKYPNLYDVLIAERNIVMANNLADIIDKNKDKMILAVVGAGHEEEIIRIVKQRLENHKNAENQKS